MRERRDLNSGEQRARRRLVLFQVIVSVLTLIGAGAEVLSQASAKIILVTVTPGIVIALLIRFRIETRY